MNKKYYEYAVQLYNQEFRTIGERTNSALIVETILISGLMLVLIYEGSILGYIFPYVVTGIILVGGLIAFTLHVSGKEGAKSAFTWLRYMSKLEAGERNKPLNWFCKHHNDSRKVRNERAGGILSRFPLPYNWIILPSLLLGVWSTMSLYIPLRIKFDSSFIVESHRVIAFVISVGISIIVWLLFILILYRIKLWRCNW